jgi:DNA ligase-4
MPIKFLYVCDLLEQLESLTVRDVPLLAQEKYAAVKAAVRGWFKSHDGLVHGQGTDRVALLSTLLPERRTDRVYYLQDIALVKVLGRCLGLGRERLRVLHDWSPESGEDLASLVYRLQSATDAGTILHHITVEDIDRTLTKLAAQCRFSNPAIYVKSNSGKILQPEVILRPLLVRLSARELKWMIRLILKRYAPVELDERLILRSFHPLLPRLLQFQSSLGAAIKVLDNPLITNVRSSDALGYSAETLREISNVFLKPQLGVKVGRPDFLKARSIKHCLTTTGKSRWAIEPKYDGEYCQIHVDLNKGKRDWIQIFSKSGKDSTSDRRDLHAWVRAALRVGSPECKIKNRCVLEGEMVVYSDKDQSIQDFHKIRKHVNRSGSYIGTAADSPKRADEHLMIVFFDALLIDDEIIMARPYEERRRRLKGLVDKYPGFCVTAEWGILDFAACSTDRATRKITKLFAKAIALRCEGLILKPCDGPYFALDQKTTAGKVIKLKKDYIPGLGDTADFVIVGARKSASEMCKINIQWTDFFIACIQNKDEVMRYHVRPLFRVMDVLSRPCIPISDMEWICEQAQFTTELISVDGVQENFDILQEQGDPNMAVVFKKPFVVEVLGSSFDKPSSKSYYTLRHARVIKIHQDRSVQDAVGFHELQELARSAKRQPQDVEAEEANWRKRLLASCGPNRRQGLSQQSDATTATRSPGSTVTSPAKPARQVHVPLIRVDTAELLPGEDSPLRQRSQRALLNVCSLPTPPPSSPLLPDSGIIAPPKAVISQKRKRVIDTVEPAIPLNAGRHREAVSQLPPSHRAIASQGLDNLAQSVASYARALAEVSNNISPKSSQEIDRVDRDHDEAASRSIRLVSDDEDVGLRNCVEDIRPIVAVRSSQLGDRMAQGTSRKSDSSPVRALDMGEVMMPKRARLSRALTRSSRLSTVVDLPSLPSSSPQVTQPDLRNPSTISLSYARRTALAKPAVTTLNSLASSFHPADKAFAEDIVSSLLPEATTREHAPRSVSSPARRASELAFLSHDQRTLPPHPFSLHVFYLCPCVRNTPYITEDLLPIIYTTQSISSVFEVVDTHHEIPLIPSLSMWQRDLRQGTPELTTIAESQSHPDLQKAILVESRRPVQTRCLVDKVIKNIELMRPIAGYPEAAAQPGENIEFWDWRVMEDIVLLLKQKKQKNRIQEQLDKALQKWYLGCVTWSQRLECNIWKEATNFIGT